MLEKKIDFNMHLQQIPIPSYQKTSVVTFLKSSPYVWSVISMLNMMHTAKNIAEEKENGVKVIVCFSNKI